MLIDGAQNLEDYLDADMIQHNPGMQDGVAGLRSYLEWVPTRHEKIHRVLAEGNFVLATRMGSEGHRDNVHTALTFYDLYRAQDGKLR